MKYRNYLTEIYKYNKKTIFIVLSILITFLIVLLIILGSKKTDIIDDNPNYNQISKLILFGESEITLEEGSKYVEPGFYAISKDGELKTEDVIVTPNEIDTSKPGTYVINYVIGNKKEERTIIVKEKETGELFLTLNGESMIVLNVGDEYEEPGYEAYDTSLGDITDQVKVKGNVNTSLIGTYEIIYEITTKNGDILTKTRTVIVNQEQLEVNIKTTSVKDYISSDVVVTVEVKGDSFSYIRYPDNTISNNKISTYTITKNGYYEFYIYDKSSNYIVKNVNITTIDKTSPTGTCSAVNQNGTLTINVNADDNLSGIKEYKYYGNNKLLATKTTSSYSLVSNINQIYVLVFDNANNQTKINCTLKNNTEVVNPKYDYLEIHFMISGHNDDAILLRSGNGTILIDGGRIGCASEIVPYINTLGVKTIDAIIGSHVHYNHIQAQSKVIENFSVKKSYYPVDLNTCVSKHYCVANDVKYIQDAIKKYNIPMNIVKAGDLVKIGDMTLYFIGPAELNNTATYMENYNSSIMILKYKNNTFMFTGDAPSSVFSYSNIKPFADRLGISLKVDMLKYPHHGNTNIEDQVLNAARPKYVIVPNYNYSEYPSSANKNKIKNVGATLYQNARDGNIVLISDGNNITVKTNQSASSYKR